MNQRQEESQEKCFFLSNDDYDMIRFIVEAERIGPSAHLSFYDYNATGKFSIAIPTTKSAPYVISHLRGIFFIVLRRPLLKRCNRSCTEF